MLQDENPQQQKCTIYLTVVGVKLKNGRKLYNLEQELESGELPTVFAYWDAYLPFEMQLGEVLNCDLVLEA